MEKKRKRINCHYFYPFWKNNPNVCCFKNQPHIGDKCVGLCDNYMESYPTRNISFMDSHRMRRPDRHHDSNE